MTKTEPRWINKLTKWNGIMLIDRDLMSHVISYRAWIEKPFIKFVVTTPEFSEDDGASVNEFAHFLEALREVKNHAAMSARLAKKHAGKRVESIYDVSKDVTYFPVFPKKPGQYVVAVKLDEAGSVVISCPAMRFYDIPSIAQAETVVGQVIKHCVSIRKDV